MEVDRGKTDRRPGTQRERDSCQAYNRADNINVWTKWSFSHYPWGYPSMHLSARPLLPGVDTRWRAALAERVECCDRDADHVPPVTDHE